MLVRKFTDAFLVSLNTTLVILILSFALLAKQKHVKHMLALPLSWLFLHKKKLSPNGKHRPPGKNC